MIFPVVARKFVAKRFVLVVFVPVAFVQTRLETVSGLVTVRFAMVALVENKFVVVALVEVTLVKMPVLGVTLPICVPLIEPPLIVALEEESVGAFKLITVPDKALTVVPDAVAKPNQPVEVPLVKLKLVMVPLVEKSVV